MQRFWPGVRPETQRPVNGWPWPESDGAGTPDPTDGDWGLRAVRACAAGPFDGRNRRPLVGDGTGQPGLSPGTCCGWPTDALTCQPGTSPGRRMGGGGKPSVPLCTGAGLRIVNVSTQWPASRQYPSTQGRARRQSRAIPVSSPRLTGRQYPKFLPAPSVSVSTPRRWPGHSWTRNDRFHPGPSD